MPFVPDITAGARMNDGLTLPRERCNTVCLKICFTFSSPFSNSFGSIKLLHAKLAVADDAWPEL
eukprot:scaffold406801_cov30-Prasinocladus_malaysianus.AAC.4